MMTLPVWIGELDLYLHPTVLEIYQAIEMGWYRSDSFEIALDALVEAGMLKSYDRPLLMQALAPSTRSTEPDDLKTFFDLVIETAGRKCSVGKA